MLFSANKSVFLHAQIEGSFKVYYYDLKFAKIESGQMLPTDVESAS